MTSTADTHPWEAGYRDGLAGLAPRSEELAGRYSTAYIFGHGEGQKERNKRAFSDLLAVVHGRA